MHMSRNFVVATLLMSNILTVIGFIFSRHESLDPSVAIENGPSLMHLTSVFWYMGAMAPLIIQAVFICREEDLAISLSEKMSQNNGVSSSATAREHCAVRAL